MGEDVVPVSQKLGCQHQKPGYYYLYEFWSVSQELKQIPNKCFDDLEIAEMWAKSFSKDGAGTYNVFVIYQETINSSKIIKAIYNNGEKIIPNKSEKVIEMKDDFCATTMRATVRAVLFQEKQQLLCFDALKKRIEKASNQGFTNIKIESIDLNEENDLYEYRNLTENNLWHLSEKLRMLGFQCNMKKDYIFISWK